MEWLALEDATWAGLGAAMAGLGGLLTGWAALKVARVKAMALLLLGLTLTGTAGYLTSVALSQGAQEPTRTVTVDVATGPPGPQGEPSERPAPGAPGRRVPQAHLATPPTAVPATSGRRHLQCPRRSGDDQGMPEKLNLVREHPAETAMPIATVLAALLARALGVEDTDTILYLALALSFVPAGVTWTVQLIRGEDA